MINITALHDFHKYKTKEQEGAHVGHSEIYVYIIQLISILDISDCE